jgi:hypothetical protein
LSTVFSRSDNAFDTIFNHQIKNHPFSSRDLNPHDKHLFFFQGSQPQKSSSLRASPIHPTSSQQVGQWQAIRTQHRHWSHGRNWQIGRLHMEGWLCGRACIQWGGGGGLAAFFTAAVHGAGSLHGEFQGFLLWWGDGSLEMWTAVKSSFIYRKMYVPPQMALPHMALPHMALPHMTPTWMLPSYRPPEKKLLTKWLPLSSKWSIQKKCCLIWAVFKALAHTLIYLLVHWTSHNR